MIVCKGKNSLSGIDIHKKNTLAIRNEHFVLVSERVSDQPDGETQHKIVDQFKRGGVIDAESLVASHQQNLSQDFDALNSLRIGQFYFVENMKQMHLYDAFFKG